MSWVFHPCPADRDGSTWLQQSPQGAGRLQLFKTSLFLSRKGMEELRCVCREIFVLAISVLLCLLEGSPRSALSCPSGFASSATQKMHRTTRGEEGLGGSVGWKEDTACGRGPARLLLICFFPSTQHRHDTHRGGSEPALNKHSGGNRKSKECRTMYCLF